MRHVYYKFVSDETILNNEQTEVANNNWSKYYKINDKNTHYISYQMKKHFAGPYEIKYNKYKKPIIENGFFNISHDNKLCVGVFDCEHDIGIDVMHLERKLHDNHVKKIFNDSEPKDIRQFSLKEAYIKMIGKGIFDINLLDVVIRDGKIYYKCSAEPYNIFETMLDNYFICIVGIFNPIDFILKEFDDAVAI
jgi:phosphopantetheinyl transferase